jgi:CHAT domain
VLLDVGYLMPTRAELIHLLEEAPATTYCAFQADASEQVMEDITGNWANWIQQGQLARVLDSVEMLPVLEQEERALLRAQMFFHSGLHALALQEIEALSHVDLTKADVLVELARLACDCGAIVLATDLLRRASPGLRTLEALETGLDIAWRVTDSTSEIRIATQLETSFLSASDADRDPAEIVFAIELLADRAIATPGWRTTPEPVRAVEEIATTSAIAKEISTEGVSIVAVALDSTGALIRVDCLHGSLEQGRKESPGTFSGQALQEWSRKYPYGYAADDAHANVFYLSTESLKFTPLPPSPLIVVASTSLQGLPLNRWRVDQDFAGRTHAMAAVPSLSWLRAARAIPKTVDQRKLAWISTSEAQGGTLAMVVDRLAEIFVEHDVSLDVNSALPSDFADAKLAIVTAHGGIAPGGKNYFTRISDEGGLSVNGLELSRALRNVEVVVLFVCSGGRIDKNPSSETVSGMAKQLFDAGCSAVIASPWPLDPRVTYHWLPTFMAAWRDGCNLAEANFKANKKVDEGFPGLFAQSLAMHVFGNPFVEYK